MSAPSLNAEEYQYLDAGIGVLLNGASALPFFDVTSIDGLDSAPVTSSAIDQMGRDGGWVDAPYETIRTVTIEGTVYASVTALETYLNSLKANFAPSAVDQPFYFRTDDTATVKFVNAKSLGFTYTKDAQRRLGIVDAQINLLCQDPRIYSTALLTQSTSRGGSTPSINNVGNRDTPATMTLNGPLTAPIVITFSGTTFTYSVTITTGHSVTIDLLNRLVIDDLGNNVRPNLTVAPAGKWPLLQPGSSNTFALSSGTGAGTLQVNARSAWR